MTREPTLEQAREALFSLESTVARQQGVIAQLNAINAGLVRILESPGSQAIDNMFAAAREFLQFDHAAIYRMKDSALEAIVSTCKQPAQLVRSKGVEKALDGRLVATSLEYVADKGLSPDLIGAPTLMVPLSHDDDRAFIIYIRFPGAEPFDRSELETGRSIALLASEALAVMAREEARAESQSKSAFLATMSHEMRTPLNGIVGMADLLSRDDLSPRQRERIDAIRACGASLLSVITDILDLSTLKSGGFSLESLPCDFRTVVNEVKSIVAATVEEKALALKLTVAEEVPGQILSDPGRMRQVLVNLVGNAVKFTQKGSVEINVFVVGENSSPRLRAEVIDTGIGISKEAHSALFQEFSQIDNSIQRRFGGTGLGLAISKHIINRAGGSIGCRSKPGVGSTFWFEIPLRRPLQNCDLE